MDQPITQELVATSEKAKSPIDSSVHVRRAADIDQMLDDVFARQELAENEERERASEYEKLRKRWFPFGLLTLS